MTGEISALMLYNERMNIQELNPIIKNILKDRGIDSEEKIREYFSPTPRLTYDPFLLKNMDAACSRLLKAIDGGERICIYGDYDCDGVTSVTLLMEFLGRLTDNITYYIPSRQDEGYGLNDGASERIAADGVSLVVTVDCGCAARDEVDYMKKLGMDVIVTDHHDINPDRAPDCILIDAKQEDETYPFSQLCGCGIAFKLAQAVKKRRDLPSKSLNHCLDLVGIAAVADVVPLEDENRTFVKYGLDRIKKRERPGIEALLRYAGINQDTVNSENIAFGIGPRINSAGRLRSADEAVRLLLATEKDEAAGYAAELEELNKERRSMQDEIYENAVAFIDGEQAGDSFLVYNAGGANEGVTGIAAGKLREHYKRPVIIVADSSQTGYMKGTGRSVEGVDMFRMLDAHADLFEKFGGHAMACGFTIAGEKVEELRKILISDMDELIEKDPSVLEDKIKTDASLETGDLNMQLALQAGLMGPFGKGNEKPIFEVAGLYILDVYSMGAEKQYRKYAFRGPGGRLYAVVFDTDIEGIYDVIAGDTIDVCAEIGINTWNGNSSLQLTIRKILRRVH